MSILKVGVIGCGYWGPNLLRNFIENPNSEVVAVADLDINQLERMQTRYPQVHVFVEDYRHLFQLDLVDAVIISTPPSTHYSIARDCIENGLHVLVEKPLATRSDEITQLIAVAEKHGRILMVGHTFEYNPAVRALKELIDSGELGTIHYIDAVRASLGLFNPRLNVIWDLAPHDISILIHLLGTPPQIISATGIACVQPSIEDVAYLTMMFPQNILSHIRVSWLDPCKTRRITVVGSEKMAVYNDIESHEKIKIYDKRVKAFRRTDTYGEFQFAYHYGNIVSPYIMFEEPLRVECNHFIESIRDGKTPLTDGYNGLQVVQVIEAAQRSLQDEGQKQIIEYHHKFGANDNYVIPEGVHPSQNGNGHKQSIYHSRASA